MKTYLKTLLRVFKKHFTRLLSVIFMVVISVGFVAGIGSAVDKINYSLTDYYRVQNVSDFIIKSESKHGFTESSIAALKERYGENNVNAGMSLDADIEINGEKQLVRLYFFDGEQTVNRQTVRAVFDGGTSGITYAVRAEEGDNKIKGIPLGTEITLDFKEILSLPEQVPVTEKTVVVTKTVLSPLTFGVDGEPSYNNGDVEIPDNINDVNKLITLQNILYLPYSIVPDNPITGAKLLPKGDLYIALDNRNIFDAFGDGYKSYIDSEQTAIAEILGDESQARFITLYDNYSFSALKSYGDKVRGICYVLMVAFLLVTALVVLSTMTRLIDEERAQVACLRTLGYPAWRIIFKYMLFAMIGCGIGGAGAYFVELGVARLLYVVFNYSFTM
ncbi:MAG: hypothetical protein K2K04_02450, partial [Clostridia bacterium]|nr:hypothetical protein [Clostridia bacterium]